MKKRTALLLYFTGFLLLFVQFPLSGSLPGKVDTWFFVAAFNTIGAYLHSLFAGAQVGSAMYPAANTIFWGNYSYGQAIFFLPFKYLGFSDIWSYYFLTVSIFSLNAWGVYLISNRLGLSAIFAFIAGLFFSCCNFSFGNFDNPDALFFGCCFLSVYLFLKYLDEGAWPQILLSAALAALGVYFSSYNFLFTFILLVAGLFLYKGRFSFNVNTVKQMIAASLLALVILIPYLYIYVFSQYMLNAFNPAGQIKDLWYVSLHPSDLLRVIKGNLLYPVSKDMDVNWLYKTRAAFTGLSLVILAIGGVFVAQKQRVFIGIVFLIFLILAIGPYIVIQGNYYPALMFPFYKYGHINNYFRINIRAYFLCVFAMSFLGARALQYISGKFGYGKWIAVIAVIFFGLENIPYSFQKYPSAELMNNAGDIEYKQSGRLQNIMHLPSNISVAHHPDFRAECADSTMSDYEFGIIRDYLYMWLVAKNHQNTINGMTGFLPKQRVSNQILIQDITVPGNLAKLINNNKLSYVLFHKKFTNGCDYTNVTSLLRSSPYLRLVSDNDNVMAFEVLSKHRQ